MARTKGSRNKEKVTVPDTVLLPVEARIELLASLLVERLIEEKRLKEAGNAS